MCPKGEGLEHFTCEHLTCPQFCFPDSDDIDPDDPATEWVEETYGVEEFLCPTCKLHSYGANETLAAGFQEEFTRTEVRERNFGPPYMNE
jgi:hypothetical protein